MQENYGNTQFTLTYKTSRTIREANNRLLKALGPVIKAGLDPHVWTEIGPKSLTVHHHGYITWTSAGEEMTVRKFLYRWKNSHGFVYQSEGNLDGWHTYCSKDGVEVDLEKLIEERDAELLADMHTMTCIDDWVKTAEAI